MTANQWEILEGDCLDLIKTISEPVQLVVTSPPYGNQRKNTYGGVSPDDYVDWFLPISGELMQAISNDGSFILNIKEHAKGGERHRYVMELVLAMRDQGWKLIDQYIWHKSNSMPGRWPNRFRDGWEHLFHFSLSTRPLMDQNAVTVPVGAWSQNCSKKMVDERRHEYATGTGFSVVHSNWSDRKRVYPDNVLTVSTENRNRGHSAVYPVAIPEWFVRLFSNHGDLVLDPFSGSGTTGEAALMHCRRYVGIERCHEHVISSRRRLSTFVESMHSEQPRTK